VARHRDADEFDDIEDEEREDDLKYGQALGCLLTEGIRIVRTAADEKWENIRRKLLDTCGDEKVVLFAQPIETVMALANYLQRTGGGRPALIVGGQTDDEREDEVASFWRPDGPRFLVSSRAGGEGINLQVARRLVHVDVPWNPMDLEQRVGRIHRFGSRQTIVVDTIVVPDSREAEAYQVARKRLELIAQTMVPPERFEAVFSRVMGLVPPEELQDVLIHAAVGPLSSQDQDAIARMVQVGFGAWQAFHERFAERQKQILHQEPGLATWDDLARFLEEYGNVAKRDGFQALRFVRSSEGVVPVEEAIRVVTLDGPEQYVCGDVGGAPVFGPDGSRPRQLGLNLAPVAEILRRLAFAGGCGAAVLRIGANHSVPGIEAGTPFGVLAFVRQTIRPDARANYVEIGVTLHCFVITPNCEPLEVDGTQKRALLFALFEATAARVNPSATDPLVTSLEKFETKIADELRRPSDSEFQSRIRHAVTPLLAALILR